MPFKTIALARFAGDETEVLGKLADRLGVIEEQIGDVERLRDIAAKYEFTPIISELRETTLPELAQTAVAFSEQAVEVKITHETWTSPATREFTRQLATLLREAGFNVAGPEFATVYLVGPAYPLEFGFNPDQQELMDQLYRALLPIIRPSKEYANRKSLAVGTMRLHFGGQVVFNSDGAVVVE